MTAETKAQLEDIYLPYKPKRRTKATIAREAGLAPLAEGLLLDPQLEPRAEAEKLSMRPRASKPRRKRWRARAPFSSRNSRKKPS